MSSTRLLIAVFALLGALDVTAQTPSPKVPLVGYCFGVGDRGHRWTTTFIEGLRKRGWEDGRNVHVVLMPPGSVNNGDFGLTGSCQKYMADQNLDVLVILGHSDPHPKIPVVTKIVGVAGSPLSRSTTRNITGITLEHYDWEIDAKRVALLKEALDAQHVMLLRARPAAPNVMSGLGPADELPAGLRDAARKLGVEIAPVTITRHEDYEPAFKTMAKKPRTAAIFYDEPGWAKLGLGEERALIRLKYRKHVPIMWHKADGVMARRSIPELSPVMAYGTSSLDEVERYAYFVDRILRGAKPAELPFEQTPNRLAINVDAARKLGITFPPSILAQADWVVPHQPQFDWTTTPEPPPPPAFMERVRAILQTE